MYSNVGTLRQLAAFLACSSLAVALPKHTLEERLMERGIPVDPSGVTTITSPQGASISFKQPGKAGICETTPGVDDYAGYVRLNEKTNMFFWFFEARTDPTEKPLTLWLNGGPGSDSLIGLFEEHGPCNVSEDLTTMLNPYSWNEESNMLYLSQPVGVGFSYEDAVVGSQNRSGFFNATEAPPDGRYSIVDPDTTNTTQAAAIGAWHVLQAFLDLSPQLDPDIQNYTFNLWTESYGGHYGPAFYDYFYNQNEAILNGSIPGFALSMDTLGIINGIVDESIQAPYYPEFAVNNTYGIKSINDTIYTFMKQAYYMPEGCADHIEYCRESDRSTADGQLTCAIATDLCRSLVEEPYYAFGGRGVYDIRHPYDDPTPPGYWPYFLNQAYVQEALGVDINYTSTSSSYVGSGFASTGDFVFPNLITDLEKILDNGVRISLIYGDADYICNWFGGQAISEAINYTHSTDFRASGYVPFVVDGEEYGEVRQYGNFSFTRVYESGHEVPYYQPKAALELFRRTLGNLIISDGSAAVTETYMTNGTAEATHTESYIPLPTSTSA